MNFYLAPMEGLTGYIYRNSYHNLFNHMDKYFSPFIVANQNVNLKTRELNDILPENNQGLILIPQLLSNSAKDFIRVSKKIKELGYDEINLNLGCPSPTVVSKGRGSGFLGKREELAEFLDEIFSASVTKISIKTRIGKEQPEEFYELIKIFNKYRMEELIIHPRIQKDFYKNKPNLSIFKEALQLSKNKVCYNGDIFTNQDYKEFSSEFPDVTTLMIGRGLLVNPGLINLITNDVKIEKTLLKAFHDKLYEEYQNVLFGEKNVLYKMKELWFYMVTIFTNHEKYAKMIRKSEKLHSYNKVIEALFREQDILEY